MVAEYADVSDSESITITVTTKIPGSEFKIKGYFVGGDETNTIAHGTDQWGSGSVIGNEDGVMTMKKGSWGPCQAFTNLVTGEVNRYTDIIVKAKLPEAGTMGAKLCGTVEVEKELEELAEDGDVKYYGLKIADFVDKDGKHVEASTQVALLPYNLGKDDIAYIYEFYVGTEADVLPINTKHLEKLISDANTFIDRETFDGEIGNYPAATKTTLEAVVASSEDVLDSETLAQPAIDSACSTLSKAIEDAKATKIKVVVADGGLISEIAIREVYFAPGWSPTTEGVSATITSDGKITYTTPQGTEAQWQCQLKVDPNVGATKDKNYKLTFKAKAVAIANNGEGEEVTEIKNVTVKLSNAANPDEFVFEKNKAFTIGKTETVITATGTAPADIKKLSIDMDFFGNPAFTIELYDFNLVEVNE